jgi:uncharacterized protein YfaS (alpha-2-macroglobulin family)
VLKQAGRHVESDMEKIYEKRKDLFPEGKALLASAYCVAGDDKPAQALLGSIQSGTADAPRESGSILASPARETAILLSSWLDSSPAAPETAALAQRLMSMQKNGHWGTTQENAFALWALGRYSKQQAHQDQLSGTASVDGAEPQEFTTSHPVRLKYVKPGSHISIRCNSGTAYVFATVKGVPLTPNETAVSHGIEVARRFLTRDGKTIDPKSVKQGEFLIVEIKIKSSPGLENLAVTDLLPAGLEIENPHLDTSEQDNGDSPENAVEVVRTDVRDDRMVAFVNLTNHAGPQVFRYAVRAVTPGKYILPAVQVEAMYNPDLTATSEIGEVNINRK